MWMGSRPDKARSKPQRSAGTTDSYLFTAAVVVFMTALIFAIYAVFLVW